MDCPGVLEKTEALDSVLSDVRENPIRIDDLAAMLKIATFFVSNGHQDFDLFIPLAQRQTRPDIKISCIEVADLWFYWNM